MNKRTLYILILVAIPVILGLISDFIYHRPVIFEVITIVFGLMELLVFVSRVNRFDRMNRKNFGTYKKDKKSVEYRDYKYVQSILAISALINMALSYVYFMIFGG